MNVFDLHMAAAREARRLSSSVQIVWLRSIRSAILHPQAEAAAICRPLLDQMADDPSAALQELDSVRKKHSALFWMLDQLVIRAAYQLRVGTAAGPSRTPVIVEFLIGSDHYTYAAWRPKLLEFLISEDLLPDQVALVLEQGDFADSKTRLLAARIREDAPLRCATSACRQR